MDSENQEVLFCADDCEYRVYCNICDYLCIERFYKNHLKSQTHTNNILKTEQLKKMISNNHVYKKIFYIVIYAIKKLKQIYKITEYVVN